MRQKIVDAPMTLGDFIALRNPALLADPESDMYQMASVIDFGASGEESLDNLHQPTFRALEPTATVVSAADLSLYGVVPGTPTINDYMLFSPIGDYTHPADRPLTIATQTLSETEREDGVQERKSFVLNTSEHIVQRGETAFSISQRYNMPLARLKVINNLREPYSIQAGQTLLVEDARIVTTEMPFVAAATPAAPATTARPPATPTPAARPTTTVPPAAPTHHGGQATTVPARPGAIRAEPAQRLPEIAPRAGTHFGWPVRGRVISTFGPKPNGLRNDGINIAAARGTNVVAAENGVVAYAGNELKGMGNLLIVQHQGGWMTVYAHLDSFVVRRGDRVTKGQKIGTVGTTGRVNEPQLHFEIRRGSQAFDPQRHLR